MDGHAVLLSFDTDEPEFSRGFEVGRLWALAREREDAFTEMAHAVNAEMILRIGDATGRAVVAEDVDETWIDVTFGAAA